MDLKPYKCSTQWYAKVYLVLHKIWIIANEKVTFSLWIRGKRFSYLNLLFLRWYKKERMVIHISPSVYNTFIPCILFVYYIEVFLLYACFGSGFKMLGDVSSIQVSEPKCTTAYIFYIPACMMSPALCIFLFPLTMPPLSYTHKFGIIHIFILFLLFYISSLLFWFPSTALFSLPTYLEIVSGA